MEFPSRAQLGTPQTLKLKAFEAPRAYPESVSPQYGWGRLFFQKWFRRGLLRGGHGNPTGAERISARRRSEILMATFL